MRKKWTKKMPSSTFTNLPDEKRQRIEAALLNEFSNHTLATAQVARIVKDAQIARGAFYKYFDNLTGRLFLHVPPAGR